MGVRSHFEEEKRLVREELLGMGLRASEDLRKAITAFKNKDLALAREVIAGDDTINGLQVAIEDRCAQLIATQQPVAQDMRLLISSIKIADQMERIGDYGVHLAKAAIKLEKEPYIEPLDALEKMANLGCDMIQGAMGAYADLDAEKAQAIAAMDDEIDKLHKGLVSEILTYLRNNPEKAMQGTKIIQTSAFLERLGDHVTNICETIVYCVDGRHVELNQ